ncbi:MAG: hypothetical protein KF799_10195 [Bdellovibrionales bacterium]|nr:hypothetical protein [Bdellovibrionales bacterium]
MSKSILLVFATLVFAACSSAKKASGPVPKQVEILFNARAGETFATLYHSNARTQKFSEGQLTNDRYESVDFTVETKTVAVKNGEIATVVKTVEKDGTLDLHNLAFPELKEEIEFVVKADGEVLKAGKYPPQSIYFVPSLPIPGRLVEVGDTWTMEHTWYSSHEAIPLKLSVVGILKDIVSCEGGHCADMEVSGGVSLALPPNVKTARFDSRVWGRLLFSLARGDVIWSEMRSREEMSVEGDRSVSESCMISRLKTLPGRALECDPREQAVVRVPRF